VRGSRGQSTRCASLARHAARAGFGVAAWLGAASLAQAQQDSSALYRSAYFLGRGDTGIAVADDEDAIFYNPAGIAQGKGIYKKTVLASPMIEFSRNSRDLARRLSAENADAVDTVREQIGKPNHVGVTNFTGLILRRAALGVIASSHADLLAYKAPEEGGLEKVRASADESLGATFSLAESFLSEHVLVGVTGKYLERGRGDMAVSTADADQLEDKLKDKGNFLGTGTGGGADVGVMFKASGKMNAALGVTVNDVGNTHVAPSEPTTLDLDLKQTINVGASIEPGTKFSRLRLLADYRDVTGHVTTNPRKRTHVGAELGVLGAVGVTAGLNQGYPTAGLYVDLYVVRFDVGAYTEEVGDRVGTRPDTRYFFRLSAGF
jgi:hypothetical protein